MQPDTITLAVDVANNGTTVNYDFTRYEENLNRTKYIGENHSIDTVDMCTIFRTPPKQSGNFRGVAKSSFKFTKDGIVLGVDGLANLTSPIIAEVSFSIPVGTSTADVVKMRQRIIALLDQDTFMNNLNVMLMI